MNLQLLFKIVRPLDRRPIYEISKTKYHLHGISKPGPFDWIDESRQYIAPLDAMRDNRTREVNLRKPVRGGGSVCGDLFDLYVQDNDPGDHQLVLQTDPDVGIYASKRTIPNFLKSLPDIMPRQFPKGEGEIKLNNGFSFYLSGPGLSNFQSKFIRYMRLEEPWMYPKGTIGQARARLLDSQRMHISKLICISQAGPMKGSIDDDDWYQHCHEAESNHWNTRCLGCGKLFQPLFTGRRDDDSFWGVTFKTHKRSNGDYDVRKSLDGVHYRCPHCPYMSLDTRRTKTEWNRTGEYQVVGDSYVTKRTFTWESVIMDDWSYLTDLWLTSCNARNRGNYTPMLQFYQKYRAIFMDEETLLRTDRRFGKLIVTTSDQTDWPEEYVRFMTVDKQMDHYWVLICAWSKDGTVRRLYFGRAFGLADLEKISTDYKVKTFINTKGRSCVFMDSAFEPAGVNGVFAACCKYGWIAVRGENPQSGRFLHPGKKQGQQIARSYSRLERGDPGMGTRHQGLQHAVLIQFVKNIMNSRTQGLIDKERIEHASDLGKELEDEYRAQMASRILKKDYDQKRGTTKTWWWEGKNDHARDCWNMQVLAATLADCLPDQLEESA